MDPKPSLNLDPFQRIGEDAHRQILGYVLCLPAEVDKPKRCMSAFFHYYNSVANRAAVKANNPEAPFGLIARILSAQYKSLTKEEVKRWHKIAKSDRERYQKEMQRYVAYKYEKEKRLQQFLSSCRDFPLVSHSWRDVTGDLINLHAPVEFITPSSLALLKRRASSLDLLPVRAAFVEDIKGLWRDERWPPSRFNQTAAATTSELRPLDAVVSHYAGGNYDALAGIVADEYRKFLVVKSVEVIAMKREVDDAEAEEKPASDVRAAWLESAREPSKLVALFWRAHVRQSARYAADCRELAGQIIDGSVLDSIVGADYTKEWNAKTYIRKRKCLYPFEQRARSMAETDYLFDDWINFMQVAERARQCLSKGSGCD
mmetsp:Transcript_55634/g.166706  ORF Transcript_55634/g.166706 Transcript_55634/m.166706 type:complete len:373 (-) Transcript_55634:907-2025(-)